MLAAKERAMSPYLSIVRLTVCMLACLVHASGGCRVQATKKGHTYEERKDVQKQVASTASFSHALTELTPHRTTRATSLAALLLSVNAGDAFNPSGPRAMSGRALNIDRGTFAVAAPQMPLRTQPCSLKGESEDVAPVPTEPKIPSAEELLPVVQDSRLELPHGALVVVAGAGTPLGRSLVRALSGAGNGWRVRALVSPGSKFDLPEGCECESVDEVSGSKMAGADAVLIVSEAAGGKGGIQPSKVRSLLDGIGSSTRRIVMVSAHGTDRCQKSMDFTMQNVFGQLDNQRGADADVRLKAGQLKDPAEEDDPDYVPAETSCCFTVLHVGKLKDDGDVVPLSAFASAPASRAELGAGDSLKGEVPVSTAAAVLLQSLKIPEAIDADLSLGEPAKDAKPIESDATYWDDQFLKAIGPEVYRKECKADTRILREWAKSQLTNLFPTPTSVVEVDKGVLLRFFTSRYLEDEDEEDESDSPKGSKAGKPDGSYLIITEKEPSPRVRVTRAEMKGVFIKVDYERKLLDALDTLLRGM